MKLAEQWIARKRLLAATAILGLSLAHRALAQPPGPPPLFAPPPPTVPTVPVLEMAQQLAGLRIYLRITPAQESVWDEFATAILAMAPPPRPLDAELSGSDAFTALDQLATLAERLGRATAELRGAGVRLKNALTPDQIKQANALWITFRTLPTRPPMLPFGAPPPR